jgi:hypothetical protein
MKDGRHIGNKPEPDLKVALMTIIDDNWRQN